MNALRKSWLVRSSAVATAVAATLVGAAGPASAELVAQREYTVGECDANVATGLVLRDGDLVEIWADGTIWAGVWFTGRNGPAGWAWGPSDKFPNTTARPYSLIGFLSGQTFEIGDASTRYFKDEVSPGPHESELFLRINDDVPCNGNGAFRVFVNVYRG
jgi:hypothetical protein